MFAIFYQKCSDFPKNAATFRSFHGAFTELSQSFHGAFTQLSRSFRGAFTELSGIGTCSAGVCIWPIDRLFASSCARPAGHSPRLDLREGQRHVNRRVKCHVEGRRAANAELLLPFLRCLVSREGANPFLASRGEASEYFKILSS